MQCAILFWDHTTSIFMTFEQSILNRIKVTWADRMLPLSFGKSVVQ